MSDLFLIENAAATTAVILIVCDQKFYESAVSIGQKFAEHTKACVFVPIKPTSEADLMDQTKLRLQTLPHKADIVIYVAGAFDQAHHRLMISNEHQYCKLTRLVDVIGDCSMVASIIFILDLIGVEEEKPLKVLVRELCFVNEKLSTGATATSTNSGTFDPCTELSLLAQKITCQIVQPHNMYSLLNRVLQEVAKHQISSAWHDSTVGELTLFE